MSGGDGMTDSEWIEHLEKGAYVARMLRESMLATRLEAEMFWPKDAPYSLDESLGQVEDMIAFFDRLVAKERERLCMFP